MEPQRMSVLKERIGERLADLSLSAKDASRQAGLGLSYIDDIFSDKAKSAQPHNVQRLAKALQCKVSWLRGDDRFPDDPANHELVTRAVQEIIGECRDLPQAMRIARKVIEVVEDH